MRLTLRHCIVAASLLLAAQAASSQTTAAHTFQVFIRGAQAGSEEVTVMESPDGWTLRGSGRLREPLDLTVEYWEARYDRNWKPIELTVNLAQKTDKWTVHTGFSGTTAATDVAQNGQNQRKNQTIAADSVVLPNLVFGSYEALAARLADAAAGAQIPAYIAPQNSIGVTVSRVVDEKIQVPGRSMDARHWTLRFGDAAGAMDMEMWTEGSRLLRIDIPSQMLSVIRDDISAVSARLVRLGRPNDEQVAVPANGFSLAATFSKPTAVATRLPAVVLVSSTNAPDRDEVVAGIPILAELATSLADAGFIVARYDRRGTGQSGGRSETATYEDLAADARSVIGLLAKRKDVDPKKIAILGYGEGGWISLAAAARESKISAIVLVGTAAASGTELVLEQQRRLFEGSDTSAEAREKAVEQQKLILQAVITGKGLESLSSDIRRRVDTPTYRSFLTFDPAQAINKTRQPLLVVQAGLDAEIPAHHGQQLAQLARSRIKAGPTGFVQLPGLNHLLARAETGRVDEYGTLSDRNVSPAAILEIASWLKKALLPNAP
jgi:uncharacterized protein